MKFKDDDTIEKHIRKELDIFKKAHVEVGIRGGKLSAKGFDILSYALKNEFGVKKNGKTIIPERSFVRSTADEKKQEWRDELDNQLLDILDLTSPTARVALSKIGKMATNDIKGKISSNIPPENADSTKIKKAGSVMANTATLIDNGDMRRAVNYVIEGL